MGTNNQLTQEQALALFNYDPDTGELRWKVNLGRKVKAGSLAGSMLQTGYCRVKVYGVVYLVHRLAWLLTHGCWPTQVIDHINGDPADNRMANLRECSPGQNHQNRQRRYKSGLIGTTYHKASGKWQASICVRGKAHHLGIHSTEGEAHAAYVKAKALLHDFNPVLRATP